MNMIRGNRSGHSDIDRNDEYYRRNWEETIDKMTFTQAVFHPYPALVRKSLTNGHRNWAPYYGEEYDRKEYDLVEDMWDHEHCNICNVKISDKDTYWFNQGRIRILCDECHDYYNKS